MWGKKPKHKNIFLALDVGTEVVKALAANIYENKVQILSVAKEKQGVSAMKGGVVSNLRSVAATCAKAVDKVSEEVGRPKKVVMGIAGELVKGIMVEASYQREDSSSEITNEEFRSVIEKARKDAQQECRTVYSALRPEGETSGGPEIVEVGAIVSDIKVDGYKVEEAQGLQGKQVTLRIYYTYAPRLHIGYMHSLAENLGLDLLAVLPEPFTVIRAIKQSKDDSFQGIMIDIGGGTTDIAIVKKGILVGTEMIAFGGRVFTKRIAQDLMINHEDAEHLKLKYSSKDLVETKAKEVKEAVRKDVPIWIDGMELALLDYQEEVKVFPDRVMLCGGGSLLPEIKSALVEYPWTKRLAFNRAPKIEFLTPENIDGIIDKTLSLTKTEDVTPIALARYGLEIDGIIEE